jgi:hypothetical protein
MTIARSASAAPRAEPVAPPPTAQPELPELLELGAPVAAPPAGVMPAAGPLVGGAWSCPVAVDPPPPPAEPELPVASGVAEMSRTPPNVPTGDWHIFVMVAGGVVPPDGSGSPGAMDAPPAGALPLLPAGAVPVVPGLATPRRTGTSTQVHAAGQSVSAVQVVAFGVQEPGKLVVVMHVFAGGLAPPAAPPVPPPVEPGAVLPFPVLPLPELALPELAVPIPATGVGAPPPPEQAPVTVGAQVKPLPQSPSALQGSCHL